MLWIISIFTTVLPPTKNVLPSNQPINTQLLGVFLDYAFKDFVFHFIFSLLPLNIKSSVEAKEMKQRAEGTYAPYIPRGRVDL